MKIEGKKNLELLKRALDSHLVSCSAKALSADDKTSSEKWDPEISEINTMLDAVDFNLKLFNDDPQPAFAKIPAVKATAIPA